MPMDNLATNLYFLNQATRQKNWIIQQFMPSLKYNSINIIITR